MQDTWMIRKAEEIQGYVDQNDAKNFFQAAKSINGPCIKRTAPLLISDGTTLLMEKSQLLKRWAEHFRRGTIPGKSMWLPTTPRNNRHTFAARQLHEKYQEMQAYLYTTVVDLMKASDMVNRDRLWKIMQKFVCTEQFTHMVRQLHDGMMARITDNGTPYEAFAVTNGVKHGCVLAPTLFSRMLPVILMDAYHDGRPESSIAYRTDGHFLNIRRMQPQCVSTATVHDLSFAANYVPISNKHLTQPKRWSYTNRRPARIQCSSNKC
ncbi:unnamed protein product [Schistocephalus solidus]|uniref:Reverse transcriptase domain-containing protein n=1 Tax=Schistocephalus solidus TaxID=70667 RepID=A0A183TD83_SCHSO|nr:unnamed protein product [Schistocephalus solidus]